MDNEKDAGIIIYKCDEGSPKFLFLKRKKGWLDLPKGHLESNETIEQAAIRETFEETGIKIITLTDKFRFQIKYIIPKNYFGFKSEKTVDFFLKKIDDDQIIKISDEHVGYIWLNEDSAIKLLSFENQIELLKNVSNYIKTNRLC